MCHKSNWNSKMSQNGRNVFFFEKIDYFWKKTWFFFKIVKDGKFAVEWVSNDIFFFWQSLLKISFPPQLWSFSAKKSEKF